MVSTAIPVDMSGIFAIMRKESEMIQMENQIEAEHKAELPQHLDINIPLVPSKAPDSTPIEESEDVKKD